MSKSIDKNVIAKHISDLISLTSNATCEYKKMPSEEEGAEPFTRENGNVLYAGREYMVITCSNGYKYYVNVTADSPLAAAAETLELASYKL